MIKACPDKSAANTSYGLMPQNALKGVQGISLVRRQSWYMLAYIRAYNLPYERKIPVSAKYDEETNKEEQWLDEPLGPMPRFSECHESILYSKSDHFFTGFCQCDHVLLPAIKRYCTQLWRLPLIFFFGDFWNSEKHFEQRTQAVIRLKMCQWLSSQLRNTNTQCNIGYRVTKSHSG